MKKQHAPHSESLGNKLLLVFFVTNLVLGILVANNFLLTGRFLREIGHAYEENARLHTFLKTLEETDKAYQDFLRSKSDTSLAAYYNGWVLLGEQTQALNVRIMQNDTALLERSIARLTDSYINATNTAIQGKRARDIFLQRTGLTQSEQLYQYIAKRVEALSQSRLENNYAYYTQAQARVDFLQRLSLVVFVLVFISNALFFVLLIHKVTTPLKQLARASNDVSRGNYNIAPLSVDTNDEIAALAGAFDNMVQNIQRNLRQIEEKNRQEAEFRKKEYEMETYLKTAQLKSLQEQVNPHFLFNCLNTAAQLSMMEGADRACRFIEDVADFYRYNLKLLETDTLLESELAFIETYVDIMRVRFGEDMFRFSTQVDETLLSCRVPSLILQPIVENCFNHGIRHMESGGEIVVRVYREDGCARICIRDNGPGFSKAFLRRFRDDFGADFPAPAGRRSIGLANVARRIALYYGSEDCVSVYNREDTGGAEVSIRIPIQIREVS